LLQIRFCGPRCHPVFHKAAGTTSLLNAQVFITGQTSATQKLHFVFEDTTAAGGGAEMVEGPRPGPPASAVMLEKVGQEMQMGEVR